ncbi:RNA polymerase factor sigma C [Mesobacillus boroniphilus]|uniref:RNA polymerase factor sigma C n=1 Tax=Mesobacillus boroniphilus TaxID=308892 RepID=A0A944CNB3_9BACI|nr:sigma-70 family RNA polymerase sigma factor [Mesobacillus boroniphilus]MBS8265622.1 RNA polymerase factor sigma C [Mesobacillus boroniphilus]
MQREKVIVELMEQYGTDVLHLAYSYVRNRQTAEDLAQEIFLKCYQKFDTFQGEAQIQTWLYRVASNHCKDYLKSWHHRKVFVSGYISSMLGGQQAGPEKQLIQNAENKELVEAMFKLPVKYREIIYLFYYQEMPQKEIAEVCGLNINTVKSRLTRAKQLLKEILQERGVDLGRTAEETEIRSEG